VLSVKVALLDSSIISGSSPQVKSPEESTDKSLSELTLSVIIS